MEDQCPSSSTAPTAPASTGGRAAGSASPVACLRMGTATPESNSVRRQLTGREAGPAPGIGTSRQAAPPFRIELAGPAHAQSTRAIYNREIETGTATFEMSPRSEADQLEWIAEHSGIHPAVVAIAIDDMGEERVIGFGSLSPYRPRPAYSTTVEDSVYIADEFQGIGVGRAVLEELLLLAEAHGFHTVLARISGDNDASVSLHSGCGFEMIGTEKEVGRKFGRWLDVVCMQKLL